MPLFRATLGVKGIYNFVFKYLIHLALLSTETSYIYSNKNYRIRRFSNKFTDYDSVLDTEEKLFYKEPSLDVLADKLPTFHQVAQLLRKFTNSFSVVKYAQLHYRALKSDKMISLKNAEENFSKEMSLSPLGKSDILW